MDPANGITDFFLWGKIVRTTPHYSNELSVSQLPYPPVAFHYIFEKKKKNKMAHDFPSKCDCFSKGEDTFSS